MIKTVFIIFILCFCFAGCGDAPSVSVTESGTASACVSDGEESLIFRIYPPSYKEIKDIETIRKIRGVIDSAEKTPLPESEPSGGWYIYLEFSDGTHISLLGETLNIDGSKYRVDASLQEELADIYENYEVK